MRKGGGDAADLDEELHLLYRFIIEGSVGHASTDVDEPRPSANKSVQEVRESTDADSHGKKSHFTSSSKIHSKIEIQAITRSSHYTNAIYGDGSPKRNGQSSHRV